MDRYLELRLLPDPEFPSTQLMSALFAKLHRGLYDLHCHEIGISFPEIEGCGPGLGTILRLHGSIKALDQLMALNWLTGMRDHLHIGAASIVPEQVQYRCVGRVQVDSSPQRARRRLIKRHGLNEAQAQERIPDSAAKRSNLPFVSLHSRSNSNTYQLFINHGPLLDHARPGSFSHYGLSQTATIPWF